MNENGSDRLNAFSALMSTYFKMNACHQFDGREKKQAASHERHNVRWRGLLNIDTTIQSRVSLLAHGLIVACRRTVAAPATPAK